MPNVAYLQRKTHMSIKEIMKLPYTVYLSLLKENQMMDLQETEQGREYLKQIERLSVTTPDFSKLRSNYGYQKAGEKNECRCI